MLPLARALLGVASDVLRLIVSFLRSSRAIRAENLILRRQLARYIERGIKPRRVDHATRVTLALLTRLCDWRNAVAFTAPCTPALQGMQCAPFGTTPAQPAVAAKPSALVARRPCGAN